MSKSALLSVVAALAIPAVSFGQIFTESFEADPTDPASQYTLSPRFDDGSFDFFDQYLADQPETTGNAARDDFVGAGFDGNGYVSGQDIDNVADGGNSTGTGVIAFDPINVLGFTDLSVSALFGALSSEPNFFNYESSQNDGIEIFASLDGGTPFLVGAFVPTDADGDGDGGDLQLDSNLDGVGDGGTLSTTLQRFTFPITGSGSLLSLSINLTSTDSFEPIVVDGVVVDGVIPEPASLGLLSLGALGLLRRKR